MAKYKCTNPKCPNKNKESKPGYCPECGKKLLKDNNMKYLLIAGGGLFLLILIAMVLAVATYNPALNTTNNQTEVNQTPAPTPAVASNVFENKYYKFTLPPGTTVKDLDGNIAPTGGDNENLQLWDSSVNSKDIDGKEIGYAEIGTGRMDGNAQNTLITMGYTTSKTIAGYQSYYLFTPASKYQEAFGDYTVILGESKVQPGRTDTFSIMFNSDTADKIKIVTDSLVIKSSAIK